MKKILKVNNKIINDFFKDYECCIIETIYESVPLIKSRDNLDAPKGGYQKTSFIVKLKGYQPMYNKEIYRSAKKEDCINYINQFFSFLSDNTTEDQYLNLDELIKI